MLPTSIAALVVGCFSFCPFDCDYPVMVVGCAAAVETGCMIEKYIPGKGCTPAASATTKGDIYVPGTVSYTHLTLPTIYSV